MRILHVVPDVAMYSRHLTRPSNLALFWHSCNIRHEIWSFFYSNSYKILSGNTKHVFRFGDLMRFNYFIKENHFKKINWKIHEQHLRMHLCINTILSMSG